MTEDRLSGIQRRVFHVIQEELAGWINDLMRGMLDPSQIMAFARAMGIDLSQLSGLMGQQPGFDPYLILGLSKSASDDEVTRRYRLLMNKLHPDHAGREFQFLAALVNLAYQAIRSERGIK